MKFIDEVIVKAKAGHGGAGAVSFRREKFIPFGGPDGGEGGKGGDVIFEADPQLATLIDLRYKRSYIAPNGKSGSGSNRSGLGGEDIIVKVPLGTIIKTCAPRKIKHDDDENQDGDIVADEKHDETILCDLNEPGMRFLLCKGGRGGKGNSHFATSTNQAPKYSQPGEDGQSATVRLELKLLADVGLVGMPNAGKSSMISKISAAKPKIADYPFTTLTPNLGVVRIDYNYSFVIADIPGLIEGAHLGHGLGNKFLKHIERTKVLVHLVDCSDGQEFKHSYKIIKNELLSSPYDLKDKIQVIALNKLDSCSDRSEVLKFKKQLEKEGEKVMLTSSLSGEGLQELLKELQYTLFHHEEE